MLRAPPPPTRALGARRSSPWRNVYLAGARELRTGTVEHTDLNSTGPEDQRVPGQISAPDARSELADFVTLLPRTRSTMRTTQDIMATTTSEPIRVIERGRSPWPARQVRWDRCDQREQERTSNLGGASAVRATPCEAVRGAAPTVSTDVERDGQCDRPAGSTKIDSSSVRGRSGPAPAMQCQQPEMDGTSTCSDQSLGLLRASHGDDGSPGTPDPEVDPESRRCTYMGVMCSSVVSRCLESRARHGDARW